MSRTRLLVVLFCGFCVPLSLPRPGCAVIWTVNADGSADAATIRDGLALAANGDTVSVAAGTYYENQIVMVSGVHLTSETGQADCVTVDPQGKGRGFYCLGTGGGAIVGFTVRNGHAAYGGGLFCISLSTPDIVNCLFVDNTALVGGGAYLHHSPVVVTNTVFSNNTAEYFGGGVAVEDFGHPTFVDCSFTGNAADAGAGVWAYLYSSPTLQDCEISGNRASSIGGGVQCSDADATIRGCRITGNTAQQGGGIGVRTSHPALASCTIAGNHATEQGGGILAGEGATIDVENTIVWGNCAPGGAQVWTVEPAATVEFGCSNVDDGAAALDGLGSVTWTEPSFHDDPLFCLPGPCLAAPTNGGEYAVGNGSPCTAANSGGCGLIGALGPGECDTPTLTMESRSWGTIKSFYRTGGAR